MKRILVPMTMATAMATAATVHVAPDGADTGAGTREAPFRTLAKTRDALRNAPGDAGAMRTVVLGGGIHRLTGTFELDARDANTTFRAADGQEARLSGGIQAAIKDLQPVADKTILERLPAEVRSKVVQLELPGKGPGDTSTWPERFRGYAGWPEIYHEGSALRLARWPNSGYARIAKVLDRGSRPRFDETPDRGGRFSYKEDNPGKWNTDQPVYLGGYWSYVERAVPLSCEDRRRCLCATPAKHDHGQPDFWKPRNETEQAREQTRHRPRQRDLTSKARH